MDRKIARQQFAARLRDLLDSGRGAELPTKYSTGVSAREGLAIKVGRGDRTIRTWISGEALPRQAQLAQTLDFLFGTELEHDEDREALTALWRRAKGLDRPSLIWSGEIAELPFDELAVLWAAAEADSVVNEPWLRRLFGPRAPLLQERLLEKEIDYRAFTAATDPGLARKLRKLVVDAIADEVVGGAPILLRLAPLLDTQESQESIKARRKDVITGVLMRLQELRRTPREILARLRELLSDARSTGDDSFLAGNLVNLYAQMSGDLAEMELNDLILKHADLSDVAMHNTDLRGARLADCVLADTFGSVWQVGFSGDDRAVLASSVTGQVRAFGIETATTLQIYGLQIDQQHKGWSFGFAHGYQRVASAGGDGNILVWDDRGNLKSTLSGHQSRVRAVAILPDRSIISCSEDSHVYRWRTTFRGGQKTELYSHNDRATTLALAPSNDLVASGAGDGEIIFYNLETGETQRVAAHSKEVRCVRFSRDGARLVSIADDHQVRIWDVAQRSCIAEFTCPSAAKSACFLGDSHDDVMVGSDDGFVSIWRLSEDMPRWRWEAHSNLVRSVASSSDGRLVATGGDDQTVQIWRLNDRPERSPTLLRSYPGYLSQARAVAFTPSGELASAHDDGQIHLWELDGGKTRSVQQFKAHTGRIWSLGLLDRGELLVSAGEDGVINVWDSPDSGPCQTWLGHEYRVFAIACRDHPSVLVASAGSDKTVRLWELGQESAIQVLAGDVGHSRRVRDVTFAPSGSRMVSVGEDGQVIVWEEYGRDWQPEMRVTEERPVTSARFTPNGLSVVYVTDAGELVVWSFDAPERRRLKLSCRPLLTLSISHNGRRAVVGSEDGMVHPVDLETLQSDPGIQAHGDWVEQVLFSPDSTVFATASDDQEVHVYDSDSRELVIGPLKALRPYEGLRIDRVSGIDDADHAKLLVLGATSSSPTFFSPQERR